MRYRSVGSFLYEVSEVKSSFGIDTFLFCDDVFTFNINGRLEKLCAGLEKLDVGFRCNGRASVNKYEDFSMLKKAGCEEIAFGIESGSQRMLNLMNKKSSLQQNYNAITEAKAAGLSTKAYILSGFPGETWESINETIKFMGEARPDKFTVFAFVPLPGCDVLKNPEKYGVTNISSDWDQFYNIAGQYEGGITFETKDMSKKDFKDMHRHLVKNLMAQGQNGPVQNYFKKLKI